MAAFQAKTDWKTLKKRENKNYRFVSFRFAPTRRVRENSKKIAKEFNKLKDTVMASCQAKIGQERPRKRKNKNFLSVPFRSYPTGNRKFPKKRKKK